MSLNPSTTISGNGILGQVTASYTTGSSSWNIVTQNLPGQVATGTFPNANNSSAITAQAYNFTWPARGGRNYPAKGTRTQIPAGIIGISSPGIVIHSPKSGLTVIGISGSVFNINGVEAAIRGEDIYGGKPTTGGAYHYQDNRFIQNNAWGSITSSTWATGYTHPNGHSKIVGWSRDGYPIYGPFGYVDPLNTSSGIARMESGYQLSPRTDRPIGRTIVVNGTVVSSTNIVAYSVSGVTPGMFISGAGISSGTRIISLSGTSIKISNAVTLGSGAILSLSYPPGIFTEDYTYALPTTSTTLDFHNGRYTITPDFPNGTYAYFITETSNGISSYPYVIGNTYYGSTIIDSTDSSLSSITTDRGNLVPTFVSTLTNYTIDVANTVTNIRFTVVKGNANSTVLLGTSTLISNVPSNPISLIVGLNTSTIVVTSEFFTTSTYTITVNRLKKSINTLESLSVNEGALSPQFNSTVTNYSITVSRTISSLTFNFVKTDASSTVNIVNNNLSFGINFISIIVTAEDGSIRTYTINATRLSNIALLSNIAINGITITNFSSSVYYYTSNYANTVTTISLLAQSSDNLSQISINNGAFSNGLNTSLIGLNPGVNVIPIKVRSSDLSEEQIYRIDISRAFSTSTSLSNLTLSVNGFPQSLLPAFNQNVFAYVTTVTNNITSISVVATLAEQTGRLLINGIPTISGTISTVNNLSVGLNQIVIGVVAPDLVTTSSYIINVTRIPSNVSTLSSLLASNVVLDPAVTSNVFSYTETVGYDTQNTRIIPTASHPGASITVNGVSVLSGQQSQIINLSVGTNTIFVNVLAENGISSSTYQLNIFKRKNYDSKLIALDVSSGQLVPTFDQNIFNYSVEVPFNTPITEITPFLNDVNAFGYTITDGITNIPGVGGTPALVGLKGNIVNDTWEGTSTFAVIGIAQDEQNTSTYILNITRRPSPDSLLSSLSIPQGTLEPIFDPEIFDYFISVPNTTEILEFKAVPRYTLAKVFYEDTILSTSSFTSKVLYVGINSVSILCVAADGVTSSKYNIFIARASAGLSNVARLKNLEIDTGSFTTKFSENVFSYNLTLPYNVQTIRVKPTKVETNSSIQVNSNTVISGQFSNPISVPQGNSVITISVLAADNATYAFYYINVEKTGNTDSSLSDIIVSTGQLDKIFNSEVTQYTVAVKNSIDFVSVRPIVKDSQAEVYVDNLFVPTGSWSVPSMVNVGENIVTIIVTAGDRFTKTIYQIKFIRDNNVVVNPQDLFLIDDSNNINVNFIDKNLFRIFTRANTVYVNTGSFSPPPSLQNIELVYPYRGGINESGLTRTNRPNNGIIGITLVGIPIYGPSSGITIEGINSSTWTLDAVKTFLPQRDFYGGYVTSSGVYNYKDNTFTKTDSWKDKLTWFGNWTHANGHSKIIGFAADGYPIYGPYGYSNPVSSYSPVIPMVSKYSARDTGVNRPESETITYIGNALGAFIELTSSTFSKVKLGMRITGESVNTTTSYIVNSISTTNNFITLSADPGFGPFSFDLTASYPAGYFIEDYFYDESKQGTLDRHNGRFCVTPEYPYGTYAYFATGIESPEYPYVIGNTFYGLLSDNILLSKSVPLWTTAAGFVTTATENVGFSRTISATGTNVSYKIISGDLPPGLRFNTSTGVISGVPSLVWQTTQYEFTARAQNQNGVSDRTFRIDVRGATPPAIVTFGPRFAIGPSGENYIVNGQIVDFQFTAVTDVMPEGKSVFFYIKDEDGVLPPGLTLTSSGRLYGQVLDDLSLPYRAGINGKYDIDYFDVSPYEHEGQQEYGIKGRYVNKTYRFFLTASNGPSSVRVEYIIDVRDPSSLIESNQYPIAPQWLGPSNLGTVLSGSYFVYSLETYDCDEGGGIVSYDWITANGGDTSVLPPGLNLDINTGIISGRISYTPVHKTQYSFNIRVIKNNILTGTTRFRSRQFTLTVLGTVNSELLFSSDTFLGTLYQGEQSELTISAYKKNEFTGITYSLQSGSLPPGLSLASDGSIQGQVNYVTTQTNLTTYSFIVRATDSSQTSIQGNFSISVNPYEGIEHTKILMRPLLSLSSRLLFDNFISDQTIFNSREMYRPLDPNFNIRKNVEFVLEYAIEQALAEDYSVEMVNYFSRKKLQFGEIKSAFALNEKQEKIYEVVYVELIDNLVNSTTGNSISPVLPGNVYPNSIDNMRNALGAKFKVDDYFIPKFMKTVQDNSGKPLGKILCMPLCYCIPGQSKTIISRIIDSGFDFKKIHFDIDRLIVENILEENTAKYLLFPKRG